MSSNIPGLSSLSPMTQRGQPKMAPGIAKCPPAGHGCPWLRTTALILISDLIGSHHRPLPHSILFFEKITCSQHLSRMEFPRIHFGLQRYWHFLSNPIGYIMCPVQTMFCVLTCTDMNTSPRSWKYLVFDVILHGAWHRAIHLRQFRWLATCMRSRKLMGKSWNHK